MLLSYQELQSIRNQGIIRNVLDDQINGTSIDITLGERLLIEQEVRPGYEQRVSLRHHHALATRELIMVDEGYLLGPGEFVLAHSQQIFDLPPNLSAEYKLKSSMARIGLEHLNAGWCDPGWNGSVLTLELKNVTRFTSIILRPGDRIGQVVFFQHTPVPAENSYRKRGRYNGDTTVKGAKA